MKKFFFKFQVSYKGTHYNGWQVQKSQVKTVQGEIGRALGKLCKSQQIKIIGSGRTDAGVHALGQVFRAELPLDLPLKALTKGLNGLLPPDIRILEVGPCARDFRPVQDAFWKEYQYVFSVGTPPGPLARDFMGYCPYEVDRDLMQKACALFVGTHDFCNFYCVGTKVSTTVRRIFHCELIQERPQGFFAPWVPTYYIFRVVGSGFLKQMVRLMVGAVWSVGRGKASLQDLRQALQEKVPKKLGEVVPPEGLYLKEVNYSAPFSFDF